MRKMTVSASMSVAVAAIAGSAFLWLPAAQSQQPAAKQVATTADPHRQLVATYCTGCHSARLKTGGLVLEGLDLQNPGTNAEIWEKVIRKLHGGHYVY